MKKRSIVFVILLLALSICLLVYPFISNFIFEHRADSLIESVDESTGAINDNVKTSYLQDAEEYNRFIAEGNVVLTDPFIAEKLSSQAQNYETLLPVLDNGVMGYIDIPSIDVSLPIYHGVSEEVLRKGVGHLEGTSLPIGGDSTHSVLTGHTGLSSARLLTDLEELKVGDIFIINILGDKLAYQVYDTEVVVPSDVSSLYVEDGKDLCTLVTCTPYGVNSHRLFVHGERVDYQESYDSIDNYHSNESEWMSEYIRALIISAICFILCIVIWFFVRKMKGHLK